MKWDAKTIFSSFEAGGYFYLHTIHSSNRHWFSLLFRVFDVCLSNGLCTFNLLKSPLNELDEIKSFDFCPFDLVNSQKSYKLIGTKERNETKNLIQNIDSVAIHCRLFHSLTFRCAQCYILRLRIRSYEQQKIKW